MEITMKKNNFEMLTKKGYQFFEVASALQKSIRRGIIEDACYWTTELYPKYANYTWKRLQIICCEDIGLAEPNAPVRINALFQMWERLKKAKSDDQILPIIQAVMYLCQCEKSRMIDWAKCYYKDNHEMHNMEIPDYALDMHTRRGKKMGRGVKHFFEHGAKLHPHPDNELEKYYREWCEKHWILSKSEWAELKKYQQLDPTHPNYVKLALTESDMKEADDIFKSNEQIENERQNIDLFSQK
jgi:replication-associated recombination protein RarA